MNHFCLVLAATLAAAASAAATPPPTDPLAALTSELDRRAADEVFAGAVLVARDGKVVYSQARGFADREKKIANTLDTRFRLGSMNKMLRRSRSCSSPRRARSSSMRPSVTTCGTIPTRKPPR